MKKKVCILAPRFPYPENGGDVVLLNDIIQYFKNIGYEVILVSYYEKYQTEEVKTKEDNECRFISIKRSKIVSLFYGLLFMMYGKPIQCGYYYSKKMVKILKKIEECERPDLYVCHLIRMVPIFNTCNIKDNVIVQMSDVLSKTYEMSNKSTGSFLKRIIYNLEEKPVRNYEHYVVNNFLKVVLVSQYDCDYFGKKKNIYYHNNGIRNIVYEPKYDENKIVLIGNMRTLQNIDCCLYFVKQIYPLILKNKPRTKLYIVGASPSKKILELECENIIVTGYVESVQDFIKDAVLSVAPLRVAAGIQNKVLISMASGVPVVMTSLTAKGIPELKHENNCIIEDDPVRFAQECIKIMVCNNVRNQISQNAIQMVRDNYFWDLHLQGYEKIYKGCEYE